MVENSIELLESDPMNLTKSDSISLLCNNGQFLLDKFESLLTQIIYEEPLKKKTEN